MRWERLFDDLEAELAAAQLLERDAQVAEGTRLQRTQVALLDRLSEQTGSPVRLWCAHGSVDVAGDLVQVGRDWLLVTAMGRDTLVNSAAVVGVSGLTGRYRAARGMRRFGLGTALRGLSRDRARVSILDISQRRSGGTIEAVGRDWVDVSLHEERAARRRDVRGRWTIPFAGLVTVTSEAGADLS